MDEFQAELLGMHAGDGTLYKTNSNSIVWELRGGVDEKKYYNNYVSPLLNKIFDLHIQPKHRSGGGSGSFGIQTSNKTITSFIRTYFQVGKKSTVLKIPRTINKASTRIKCAFLRGLFDTDGCIRFDKRPRYYPKIEFTSASKQMRNDVVKLLNSLDLCCYVWSDGKYHKLCIAGRKKFKKWQELVSSSNPKHLNKFFR